MKLISSIFLSTLLIVGCVAGQDASRDPNGMSKLPWAQPAVYNDISHPGEIAIGWRLNAVVDHDQTILVEIINESKEDKDIGVNNGHPIQPWYFVATKSDGKSVPFTTFYKSIPRPWEIGYYNSASAPPPPLVKPGKKVICKIDLNRILDLSEPGKYTVFVKKVFSEKTSGKWATSNKVEFSVNGFGISELRVRNE